jgi:hypothetical protein
MKCPNCKNELEIIVEEDHSDKDNSIEIKANCCNSECKSEFYAFIDIFYFIDGLDC